MQKKNSWLNKSLYGAILLILGTSKNINLIFFFNRQSLPTEADSDLNLNCIELLGC